MSTIFIALISLICGFSSGFISSLPSAGPSSALIIGKTLKSQKNGALLLSYGAALGESFMHY